MVPVAIVLLLLAPFFFGLHWWGGLADQYQYMPYVMWVVGGLLGAIALVGKQSPIDTMSKGAFVVFAVLLLGGVDLFLIGVGGWVAGSTNALSLAGSELAIIAVIVVEGSFWQE